MEKKVLAKAYYLISKKLDNCYYKNCKKGFCQDQFFISHEKGTCTNFFKELHEIIYRTHDKLAFENGFIDLNFVEAGAEQLNLDRLNLLNLEYRNLIADKYTEIINLESK